MLRRQWETPRATFSSCKLTNSVCREKVLFDDRIQSTIYCFKFIVLKSFAWLLISLACFLLLNRSLFFHYKASVYGNHFQL